MNNPEHVLRIEFTDRPHFAYDIIEKFEKFQIDKSALEILPEKGSPVMAVKFCCPPEMEMQQLLGEISATTSVKSVTFCDYMPHEARERSLQTILDSVSEGVIALEAGGTIKHINDTACRFFGYDKDELTNKPANHLFPAGCAVYSTLKAGTIYSNREQKTHINSRDLHFFISSTPIRDTRDTIIGAVATIKDYKEAEEISSKISQKRRNITFDDIIHKSGIMEQIIKVARTVSQGTSTVLLRGESGTGKEMFAKAIHMESARRSAPFIAVNCGALTDTLLESELFGYEPGAFTGAAKSGKKGLFEQANNGTIFLDEVGEVSRQMQVRLLRILQEQTLRRVGGDRDIPVNVRIIAATNRNLEEMIQQEQFREDLYYRLNVIPLTIPPLRARTEDIPLLAQHLVRRICLRLGKPEKKLTPESFDLLLRLDYPGNIRQLENMLELVINLEQTNEIGPQHLTTSLNLKQKLTAPHAEAPSGISIPIPEDGNWPPLKQIVQSVEKQVLSLVLKSDPSSRKAGYRLGVSNTTILKKAARYNLRISG